MLSFQTSWLNNESTKPGLEEDSVYLHVHMHEPACARVCPQETLCVCLPRMWLPFNDLKDPVHIFVKAYQYRGRPLICGSPYPDLQVAFPSISRELASAHVETYNTGIVSNVLISAGWELVLAHPVQGKTASSSKGGDSLHPEPTLS